MRGNSSSSSREASSIRQSFGRELLDQILEHTAKLAGSDLALTPAEREAFKAVARRHRGLPLTLEPVLVELLEAILVCQAPASASAKGFWRPAATEIGQVLLEDPVASARLKALWERLSQD
jgi:hypothetical protein